MIITLLHDLARTLLLAAAMFWTVLWALVLGFTRSAIVRVLLSREQAERNFGGQGLREVALAAAWGIGSFSPSYAAVAMARTLFKKGGSLLCALVFLFASTNLSAEFLLVLWLLMGWRVMLLEVVGGVAFIGMLWLIVRVSWPRVWSEEVRDHHEKGHGRRGEHFIAVEGDSLREKVSSRQNWASVADVFVGNWRRVWRELVLGFLLAAGLAVFVPERWWQVLVVGHASEWARTVEHALVGPLVAAVSCITSLGNLPLASVLRSEGLGLSGVLAFVYGDILALPLVLMYRKHFGPKAAAFIVTALWFSAAAGGAAAKVFSNVFHFVPRPVAPPSLIAFVSGDWRLPTLPNIFAIFLAGALVIVRMRYGARAEGGVPGS
ncbi:MAG: permease [Janthinobacterium lividum]